MTPEQVRRFDQLAMERWGIPGVVLMENAGMGCVEALLEQYGQRQTGSAVILCGGGNNGGDGFVIARHLWNRGWSVRVLLCCVPERIAGDARVMLQPVLRLPIEIIQLQDSLDDASWEKLFALVNGQPVDWIVDAMLGTGSQGAPRGLIQRAIRTANRTDAKRLAIDLPTGIDPLSGQPHSDPFRADLTCTFVEAKSGFENAAAAPFLGTVMVVPIGIDVRAIRVDA